MPLRVPVLQYLSYLWALVGSFYWLICGFKGFLFGVCLGGVIFCLCGGGHLFLVVLFFLPKL